jgi:hypothetical protein
MIGGTPANTLVEELKDLATGEKLRMRKLLANIPPFLIVPRRLSVQSSEI